MMSPRARLIPTAILLLAVLIALGLVVKSISFTKADSSKVTEGTTKLGAKRIMPRSATQSKPPSVNANKRDSQPAVDDFTKSVENRRELRERTEVIKAPIRQALSELNALEEGGGSYQQIQEKIAELQATIERGMAKDPESALDPLLGHRNSVTDYRPFHSDLFVKSDPDFAIALLDQVPEEKLGFFTEVLSTAWAQSDPKAVLAWANQQTDMETKKWILDGVIPGMAAADFQGAFAYIQSLQPSELQDSLISTALISRALSSAAMNTNDGTPFNDKLQGALAMIQSLPEGRNKDLATKGIRDLMDNEMKSRTWILMKIPK